MHSVLALMNRTGRRLKNIRERLGSHSEPLAKSAGVTKEVVMQFWQTQHFDLRLPSMDGRTPLGNCDMCFLNWRRLFRA